MPLDIDWRTRFYGISWAYEGSRLVISTVFEDRTEAAAVASAVDGWSDRFTRLTVIEGSSDEFALCCYQDPQISAGGPRIGLFRTGMRQSSGYTQAKPMMAGRGPLLQVAYAADVRDMGTYEQVSRLVPIRKCRIISERDLRRQEYYYERTAVACGP